MCCRHETRTRRHIGRACIWGRFFSPLFPLPTQSFCHPAQTYPMHFQYGIWFVFRGDNIYRLQACRLSKQKPQRAEFSSVWAVGVLNSTPQFIWHGINIFQETDWLLIAKLLERPSGVTEVVGSNPHLRISFFSCLFAHNQETSSSSIPSLFFNTEIGKSENGLNFQGIGTWNNLVHKLAMSTTLLDTNLPYSWQAWFKLTKLLDFDDFTRSCKCAQISSSTLLWEINAPWN